MTPERRRRLVGQVERPLPLLGAWARRRAVAELLRSASAGDQATARELVRLFLGGFLPSELGELSHPVARNALCREWAESREPRLETLLREVGWAATSPPAVRVLTLLLQNRGEEIALGGDRWAPALLQACADADPRLRQGALAALEALPDEEARDAACRAVLETSFPPQEAVERLVRCGWAPREEGPRALFYFVTGQLDRFEELDYDHSLLRAAYAELPEGLRARVVARIRESGRAELVKVVQADEPRRRLHGLTPAEYETVVQVLLGSSRFQELWDMVFTASPEWSAEILGLLERAGFEPPAHDRTAFEELLRLRPTRGKHLRLQLPELTPNAAHEGLSGGVRALAFSPDGKLLAVGGKSEAVQLWDPYRGTREALLPGHAGLVTALAFSPDGRLLATGGSDHGAYLWDPRRGRQLRRIFPPEAPVGSLAMAFASGGRYLAVGGWEAVVVVDLEDGSEHALRGHTECVVAVAFDPGDRWLATASWDRTVRVFQLPSMEPLAVLRAHDDRVVSLAFLKQGEELITAGRDGRVLRWRAADRFSEPEMLGYHASPIWRLACHPEGRFVATAGADGSVRLWGEERVTLPPLGPSGRTTDLAFSPEGRFLARTTRNGEFAVWQVEGGKARLVPRSAGLGSQPDCVAFAPDGRTLAVGSEDGSLSFWSLFQTRPVARMDHEDLARIESWLAHLDPAHRAEWEFVARLVGHKFRHEIELGQASGALLDEFAIDLQ